ncbi:hypothetical protein C5167_032374 [Papaver somniferum]|uniref:Uncharacterized protein n=1 Tax=Papaver somniferum TaxID=3469 RepID=A0A4Y7KA57_PAPSO|nr:uncharacterized protein LOC113292857 [Papaver somniferum]RZC69222.1 hypothetical protein C5167_032374 [Papaver somniferum]
MFNQDLDVMILFYYCYKQKRDAQREIASLDSEDSETQTKYIHFEIMASTAFAFVYQKNADDRINEVDKFIENMPDMTEKIIIPMNCDPNGGKYEGPIGEHWHLLVYDINNYQ